jgi:Fe-Mn family superoxide dismutase
MSARYRSDPPQEAAMNVMTKVLPFTLPPLPYDEGALAPAISAKTMSFHHGKHHRKYVDTLNALIQGTDYAGMELDAIVQRTFKEKGKDPKAQKIFNNAGQHWNHTFFWNCLTPRGGGKPKGRIAEAIESDLGGYEKFKEDFVKAGEEQFGSGWAWLVADGGKLAIVKTPNAETPMQEGKTCILTIDVWEHAYYLDYQNRRPDFLKAVVDHVINWDFAGENYRRVT